MVFIFYIRSSQSSLILTLAPQISPNNSYSKSSKSACFTLVSSLLVAAGQKSLTHNVFSREVFKRGTLSPLAILFPHFIVAGLRLLYYKVYCCTICFPNLKYENNRCDQENLTIRSAANFHKT